MKKTKMVRSLILPGIFLASIVFLTGASVWEGSAAVSPDFPDSGLYAATNAFPRNTVVDLTNLETGKTVRVIVAASLDTPGLLALVSREAAEEVGLRNRTIGRIRMVVPSDPVSPAHFDGDGFRSGDPDYDPLAAVENAYGPESLAGANPAVGMNAASAVPVPLSEDGKTETVSRHDPESAWADIPAAAIPEANPSEPAPADAPAVSDIQPDIPEVPETVSIVKPEVPETISVVKPDIPEVPETVSMEDAPAENIPEPAPPVVIVIPETPVSAPPPDNPASAAVVPESPSAISSGGSYGYILVPAEERPPAAYAPAQSSEPAPVLLPKTPDTSAVPQIFSVPAVAELEHGKYYLQVGAYSQTAAVEKELAKIERGYPLTVQCIGTPSKPVYRILVGPVNQGESGALIRAFKSKGYSDAFIRRSE